MTERMLLIGADDVRSGGNAVERGAGEMKQAASSISFALEQHQRFLDDWLSRFDTILADFLKAKP